MSRRLPNLNQLRAFEAAVRLESFKRAADELFVTHSAVSHQIKALEESFGFTLFTRANRRVIATGAARAFATHLTRAFDEIESQAQALSAQHLGGTIRVSSTPFYANRIVVPRLGEFHALFPNIHVEFSFSYKFADFSDGEIDAALRYGPGDWPGVDARLIHHDRVRPIASPMLLAKSGPVTTAADIARLPLAGVSGQTRYWMQWFKAAGLADPGALDMTLHAHRGLALDFALAGNAVALADLPLIRNELATGALVALSDVAITLDRGVHLATPKAHLADARMAAFADWLISIIHDREDET